MASARAASVTSGAVVTLAHACPSASAAAAQTTRIRRRRTMTRVRLPPR